MADIVLRFRVNGDELTVIDQAGNKVQSFGAAAEKSREGIFGLGVSLTDLTFGFGIMQKALSIVGDLEQLGVESLRAKESLDALSGGKTNEYLDAMRSSTRGLVTDMDLAHSATKALTLGLVENAEQAAQVARAGTILGQTMGMDARQGVETLTVAMTRIGLTELLDNIGLSGQTVRKRFEELRSVMGDQSAWSTAILEDAATKTKILEGSLDGAGTGVGRITTQWENLKRSFGEKVTVGIDVWVNEIIPTVGKLPDAVRQYTEGNRQAATPSYVQPNGLPGSVTAAQAGEVTGLLDQQQMIDAQAKVAGAILDSSTRSLIAQASSLESVDTSGLLQVASNRLLIQEAAAEKARRSRGGTTDVISDEYAARMDRRTGGAGGGVTTSSEDLSIFLQSGARNLNNTFNDVVGAAKTVVTGFADAAQAAVKFNENLTGAARQTTGGLEQSIKEREDRIRWTQGNAAADKFGAESKKAMDEYLIATGQATPLSLKLADAASTVDAALGKGKETTKDATKDMLALNKVAADTTSTMDDLYRAMMSLSNPALKQEGINSLINEGHYFPGAPGTSQGPGMGTDKTKDAANDPYAALRTSADKARTSTQDLTDKTGALATKLPSWSAQMGTAFDPLNAKTKDALKNISAIFATIDKNTGTLTVQVGFNPNSGGGDDGRIPVVHGNL